MTQFLNRVLDSLGAIYRPEDGTRGASSIDLSTPVVVVHDGSDAAGAAQSIMYETLLTVNPLAGAFAYDAKTRTEIIEEVIGLATIKGLRDPSQFDVWITGVYLAVVLATSGNFADAWVSGTGFWGANDDQLLGHWNDSIGGMISGATHGPVGLAAASVTVPSFQEPYLLNRAGATGQEGQVRLRGLSGVGGDSTILAWVRTILTPVNTRPRGMGTTA